MPSTRKGGVLNIHDAVVAVILRCGARNTDIAKNIACIPLQYRKMYLADFHCISVSVVGKRMDGT